MMNHNQDGLHALIFSVVKWRVWCFLCFLFIGGNVYAQTITTIVGTGTKGYSGDGGLATQAQINWVRDVVLDDFGNLFIADYQNACIRKVDAFGIISTFAGSGVSGYSGDGGPATEAQLIGPTGVALDGLGNVYISDGLNHRIRKVDRSGIITTVAGMGEPGYSGDGGLATQAQLNRPGKIFVDRLGHLFIPDAANDCVRMVDRSGIITTVAGTGTRGYSGDGGLATRAQLNRPVGVFVDDVGNWLISDRNNHCIRKVDRSGVITTVVGIGEPGYSGDGVWATQALLNRPTGIFVDATGSLFIADRNNQRIRKVDARGKIFTVLGNGERKRSRGLPNHDDEQARLVNPIGMLVDTEGNLLFWGGAGGHRVRKMASVSGAYVLRHRKTLLCLSEDLRDGMGSYGLRTWDDETPQDLACVWNIVDQGDGVLIQNVGSRKFVQSAVRDDDLVALISTDVLGDDFALVQADGGAMHIVQKESQKQLVISETGKVMLQTNPNSSDASTWKLERVGPVQKKQMSLEQAMPINQRLDGKQVLLGIEGAVYRMNHEGNGVYQSGFRWLTPQSGWLSAGDSSLIYQKEQIFILEYVGDWKEIFDQQNVYAQQCRFNDLPKHASQVFVLKTKEGAYLQPQGETSQPVYRVGDPNRPIVHFSVGDQPGVYPLFEADTQARDKAALFVIEQPVDDEDGHEYLYVSAVVHQWNHSLSVLSEIKNFGKFLSIWGMVAPVSLASLQACHDMHVSKPWPKEYDPPVEHWLATYSLGASIPLDEGALGQSEPHAGLAHFHSQMCFTNNVIRDRDYNPYLGLTTAWRYRFDASPGSHVRLYILEDHFEKNKQGGLQALFKAKNP